MIINLIKKIKLLLKHGTSPTADQFINEWMKNPQDHFYGYHGNTLEWTTRYGELASMGKFPNTHGCSSFPDIRCEYKGYKSSLIIGYIERISMHSAGVVCIEHFALNSQLTRHKIGKVLLGSILNFFKSKNAVTIEFHENHSSKIDHYRRFFKKLGIKEVNDRVWRVDLYKNSTIPHHVISYHEELRKE